MMDDDQDPREITDLLLRYAWAIDSKDWALLGTCFTADCEVVYGNGHSPHRGGIGHFASRDELVAFMERTHQPLDGSLHRMSNIQVWMAGPDTATAITYGDNLLVRRSHSDGPCYQSAGHYTDELMRADDEWRIASRRYTRVWAEGNDRILQTDEQPGPSTSAT